MFKIILLLKTYKLDLWDINFKL
ncbi:hypothetical protein PT2222_140202 [Paraburkholderia tropica]